MAADYLIASLPALALDGPAPLTLERFLAACREQLGEKTTAGIQAALACAPSDHPVAERWRDLETQLRNASAAERARLAGQDPAKWRRPAEGCALYWTNRITSAFQEKDLSAFGRRRVHLRDSARHLHPPLRPRGGSRQRSFQQTDGDDRAAVGPEGISTCKQQEKSSPSTAT